MDPTQNLKDQRRLTEEILAALDNDHLKPSERDRKISALAAVLAMHVEALDDWLSKGGFKPEQWK